MSKSTKLNTNWRKVAGTIYEAPRDSKIFGSVELDMTQADAFIKKKRKEGIKVTYTHIMAALISRALAFDVPELNAYYVRGGVKARKSVDVMVSALINNDSEMGSLKIESAHSRTINEIVDDFKVDIKKTRNGDESISSKNLLAYIPWPLRKLFFYFVRLLSVVLGIELKFLGLHNNSFGSYILSNIGSVGLDVGFAALMPAASLPMVVVIGKCEDKPVVRGGEIVIRKMLSVGVSLDHRIVDGVHGGLLFRAVKKRLLQLDELEKKPIKELENSPFTYKA